MASPPADVASKELKHAAVYFQTTGVSAGKGSQYGSKGTSKDGWMIGGLCDWEITKLLTVPIVYAQALHHQ